MLTDGCFILANGYVTCNESVERASKTDEVWWDSHLAVCERAADSARTTTLPWSPLNPTRHHIVHESISVYPSRPWHCPAGRVFSSFEYSSSIAFLFSVMGCGEMAFDRSIIESGHANTRCLFRFRLHYGTDHGLREGPLLLDFRWYMRGVNRITAEHEASASHKVCSLRLPRPWLTATSLFGHKATLSPHLFHASQDNAPRFTVTQSNCTSLSFARLVSASSLCRCIFFFRRSSLFQHLPSRLERASVEQLENSTALGIVLVCNNFGLGSLKPEVPWDLS